MSCSQTGGGLTVRATQIRQLFALVLAWTLTAAAQQVETPTPYPRIEVGEHTAVIKRLAVDSSGRLLVTASHDKTVRLWSLQTGRLERILRPPIGAGNEGALYAVAVSPDGERIAVGGYTGVARTAHRIHLFDRRSGRLVDSSHGFSSVVNHLRFSPDGRRVAAVFGPELGMRLLDAADLRNVLAQDDTCTSQGFGVDFAPDGRLVTSCYDGVVRLFDAQGQRTAQRMITRGARPFGVRFSPDGERIAVGFENSTAVKVLSGSDLAPLYIPITQSIDQGSLAVVAWSHDGQSLYASGQFRRGDNIPIVVWPDQGRGSPEMRDAATQTIIDLAPLVNGRVAYAGATPEWGVLESDGRRVRWAPPALLDHGGNQSNFRLSANGQRLEFGFDVWDGRKWSRALARFDLATRSLQTDAIAEEGLNPPRIDGLPITDWQHGTAPKITGQPLSTLEPGEISRSLAISADGLGFVLGTGWWLRSFDATGQQRWATQVPATALAVNISNDGRWLVAALRDGTMRWYDAASGIERLALFIHAQDKRWVLFTPEGFYQASPGGDAMIGYHLNQGTDREGLFIDSAQLAGVFFRPDLITQRIASDETAIAQAVKAVGDVRRVLAGDRPPILELLSPALVRSEGGEVDFSVRIIPGSGPVGALRLTINGAEVRTRALSPPGGGVITQRLSLAPGENVMGLRAMRADGKVASNEVQMRVRVSAPTQRPVLRVLAVGIGQYDDATYRGGVKFAARDAEKFVERLRAGARGVYREVDARLLNRRPDTNLARIDQELRALAQRAKPEDVVVIFLAGHGKAPEGREYHFIPADFVFDSDQAFSLGKTLSHGRLEAALRNLGAGKRLLILDTCDSGTAVQANQNGRDGASEQKDALARLMRSTGRYILAAASPQGRALEDGAGGHGVYTAALLEGLAGKAGQPGTPMVDVDALAEYVARRVPELTRPAGYEQRPMRSAQGENFPLIKRP